MSEEEKENVENEEINKRKKKKKSQYQMNKSRKILKEDKAEEYRDREEEQVLNDEGRPNPQTNWIYKFLFAYETFTF